MSQVSYDREASGVGARLVRLDWIDVSKGIGIILVVYGHVARGLMKAGIVPATDTMRLIDNVIYSFHMPLFFFLAGVFLVPSVTKRGRFGVLRSKVDSIVYPYVVWSLLQGGVEVVLSKFTNGDASWHEVLSLLWEPRAQFWFLWALFAIFSVSVFVLPARRVWAVLLITCIGAAFYALAPDDFLGGFQNAGLMFVFFAGGVLLQRLHGPGLKPTGWPVLVVVVLAFVALQFIFAVVLGRSYEDRGWLAIVVSCSGIATVVMLSVALSGKLSASLAKIGQMSMYIYLMHILAASGARIILSRMVPSLPGYVHIAVGVAVGIALPVVVYRLCRRFGWMFLFEPSSHLSPVAAHKKGPQSDV